MNFITGEKIQLFCDYYIGTDYDFNFNPTIKNQKNKQVMINSSNNNFNNCKNIFCYTNLLQRKEDLINKLKNIQTPFNLIFHNSDYAFNECDLSLFNKLPLIKHIYTQNMNVIHPKITPLPIGLANSQWRHGNQKIYEEIYHKKIKKTKNIYFNFKKKTNKKLRDECYEYIKSKNIPWNSKKPYKEYLIELKSHKYCICPEGNGIDTHRFWECLYMNTIPICKKNTLVDYYQKIFPIIILNKWSDLDLNFLEKEYTRFKIDHSYLDLNYILSLID